MADNYIDAFETIIYGTHARKMIQRHVLGIEAAFDAALRLVLTNQEQVDKRMTELVAKLPQARGDDSSLEEGRDSLVRFGSWLDSLKGRPLDKRKFFGTAAPSAVAGRRGSKLVGALALAVEQLRPYATGDKAIPGAAAWLEELTAAHRAADARFSEKLDARLTQALTTPEVQAAREQWLTTYTANKRLVEGVLRHMGKVDLMAIIFDDLAERQVAREDGALDVGGATAATTP